MKLAFVSTFDAKNVHKRSGTPFHMTQALEHAGVDFDYIHSLKTVLPLQFKLKRIWTRMTSVQRDSSRWNIAAAKNYARQVKQQLKGKNVQGVMTHILNTTAYLDYDKPLILWTDAIYSNLLGFVPGFSRDSAATIHHANEITSEFLERCKLAIFSSEWGARGAIELFGASKDKIHVVPFGANIANSPSFAEVQHNVKNRSRDVIKFLFLGKDWLRKGGDNVLNVVKALHAAGQRVELNIVGCHPPKSEIIPDYVNCLGYVSKKTSAGNTLLKRLLSESHFLFVPSRAEAYGIVFCEASAFGLPVLTTYVGGISTIVKDNLNGMTFALEATPKTYCDYIIGLMQNYSRYEELALSAFHEYETRLNWGVNVKQVKQLIQQL